MKYPTRQCALASVNWIQLRSPVSHGPEFHISRKIDLNSIARCFGSKYGASRSAGAACRPLGWLAQEVREEIDRIFGEARGAALHYRRKLAPPTR